MTRGQRRAHLLVWTLLALTLAALLLWRVSAGRPEPATAPDALFEGR